jgi:hypothetical protein
MALALLNFCCDPNGSIGCTVSTSAFDSKRKVSVV